MKSWTFVAAFAATSRSTFPARTSSISACSNVCMSKKPPSATASAISSVRCSRIRSEMRAFITITSTAATRPWLTRGRSRWLITPRRTPASTERICCCFAGGKNSIIRPTVSAASIVCRVEKTRWPDSAACSAVCAVSASRSSPIRIVSGSWRSTRRSAWPKLSVSSPTSRWLTMRAPVRVEDLDRVLDRDDVLVPRPVDVVDHRRERRRLSRAGGAGDEDQAAVLVREPGDAGRHAQLLEARDVARDDAERERDRAALAVDVDAEAGQPVGRVGDVEVAALVELAHPLGRDAGDRLERREQVLLVQRRALGERRDRPVASAASAAGRP